MASPAVQEVYRNLLAKEGVGDSVTSVKTGAKGLTAATKRRLKKEYGDQLTSDELIMKYLEKIEKNIKDQWGGQGDMDEAVVAALVDLGYNLGENIFSQYKGLQGALAAGDQGTAMMQTLDTVRVTDKDGNKGTSRGIARRRAENYNAAAASLGLSPITNVIQEDDRVVYKKGEEDFAEHRGAPVPSSRKGSLSIKSHGAEDKGFDDQSSFLSYEEILANSGLGGIGGSEPDEANLGSGFTPPMQTPTQESERALANEAGDVTDPSWDGSAETVIPLPTPDAIPPTVVAGEDDPEYVEATEYDEDQLNAALAGISDQESSYNPLGNQRSVFETDDPDLLEADEEFYQFMEEAGQF